MNRVVLVGRITKDPESRFTPAGVRYVRFTIAVNRIGRDQGSDFIGCVAWRTTADFIANYVHKGNLLALEGRIQTGSFQGADGQMRYTTDVVVDQVNNLTPRNQNESGTSGYDYGNTNQQQNGYNQGYNNFSNPSGYQQPSYQTPSYDNSNTFTDTQVDDDDLPF